MKHCQLSTRLCGFMYQKPFHTVWNQQWAPFSFQSSPGKAPVSVRILFPFASASSRYTHPILLSSQPCLSFSLTALRQSCDFIKTSHIFTISPFHSRLNPRPTGCPESMQATAIVIIATSSLLLSRPGSGDTCKDVVRIGNWIYLPRL
jgi:hypothetical protein